MQAAQRDRELLGIVSQESFTAAMMRPRKQCAWSELDGLNVWPTIESPWRDHVPVNGQGKLPRQDAQT